MKRISGFLLLTLLTISGCNNNADKTNKQQNQEEKRKILKIVRHFDVEPAKVFGAFTNPEEMIVWWTPDTKFDVDLRVGGQYTISRNEGETTFIMTGKYLAVEQPNQLIYTCSMPDYSPVIDTISIDIQPDGKGGSQMTFVQQGEGIDEELKQLSKGDVSASEKGWNEGFDLMVLSWKKSTN